MGDPQQQRQQQLLMLLPSAYGVATMSLNTAVMIGDQQLCKLLLAAGADVNRLDIAGATALRTAVSNNRPDICRLLLAAGAEVDKADAYGIRPLLLAVHSELPDICQILLAAGADPNKMYEQDISALLLAARKGQQLICRQLVEAGATISDCVLGCAVLNGRRAVTEYLMSLGPRVVGRQQLLRGLLDVAISMGHDGLIPCIARHVPPAVLAVKLASVSQAQGVQIVAALLTAWVRETAAIEQKWAAIVSIEKQLAELVRGIQVLAIGAATTCKRNHHRHATTLHQQQQQQEGAQQQQQQQQQLLLVADMCAAASQGDVEAITSLVMRHSGAEAAVVGNTALITAAARGHSAVCQRLIALGAADVCSPSGNGWTALHFAALAGHVDVCKVLLAAGCPVHAVSSSNMTPLRAAASMGHIAVVRLLCLWEAPSAAVLAAALMETVGPRSLTSTFAVLVKQLLVVAADGDDALLTFLSSSSASRIAPAILTAWMTETQTAGRAAEQMLLDAREQSAKAAAQQLQRLIVHVAGCLRAAA